MSSNKVQMLDSKSDIFKYKALQSYYEQYLLLPSEVERYVTADTADVIALKLFSFDAGLHNRYMSAKTYQFSKVLRRVLDSIKYQGHSGPQEQVCLAALKKKIGPSISLNSKLYYCRGYCATPDAVQLEKGNVVAIAEFKSTKLDSASAISKVVNPAKVQLEFAMRAAGVAKGYLVVQFLCSGDEELNGENPTIIEMMLGAVDKKTLEEKEAMQQHFIRDLMGRTKDQLPEALIQLLEVSSGGNHNESADASDELDLFIGDEGRTPTMEKLRKRIPKNI